jgi:UDP-N-acetylglucosamine 3-dehydrogenase
MRDKDSIEIAVIGVGAMGRHHARIYSELDNVDLVALVDHDEHRGRELAALYGCDFFRDHATMLERHRPDAASIAVPTPRHLGVALDLISAGIPPLIEKPLAATPEEGQELLARARAAGLAVAVGHVERFNPVVRRLKQLVKEGAFGEVVSIVTRRVGPIPPMRQNTNVIQDLAVHDIDVLTYVLDGEATLLMASAGHAQAQQHQDWADLMLEVGGVSCFVQVNWVTPIKVRRLSITGSKAYAEVNYVSQSIDLFEAIDWSEAKDFDDFVAQFGEPASRRIEADLIEPLRIELEAFVDSVRLGQPFEVAGEDGLRAIEVAAAASEMAYARAVVK